MKRIVLFFIVLILGSWKVLWIDVTEISMSEEQAKNVWKAVFVIENIIDEKGLDREELVLMIELFWEKKWLQNNSTYKTLLAMIDYHNRWVKMNISASRDNHTFSYEEYWWGSIGVWNIIEDVSWNWMVCSGEDLDDPMITYCSRVKIAVIENNQFSKLSIWCLWEWWSINFQPRRHLWNTKYIYANRMINMKKNDNNDQTYILQLLPFTERNYGSHWPAPFACQVWFNRIELK